MAIKEEKQRGVNFFESLVKNKAFLSAVNDVRSMDEFTKIVAVTQLIDEYSIPSNYHSLLRHYIETGSVDYTLIESLIRVISDHDKKLEPSPTPDDSWRAYRAVKAKGVYLALSFDTTQPELIKFIKLHWNDLIKPRLENTSGKRKRLSSNYFPNRDKEVYELYVNRKKNGLTVIGVAYHFGITRSQLYRIKKQQEKSHK